MQVQIFRLRAAAAIVVSLLFPLSARAQKQICIMNIDGSGMRTLVDMAGYDWVGSPYWSRDGKRLVFDAMQGGFQNNHIFLIDAAGGQPHDIGLGSQPSFSADDKQIASICTTAVRMAKSPAST
jgi:Tol biopolymer transport system component